MSTIACCLCAKQIIPNDVNMCMPCLMGEVDITESIEKKKEITQCSECMKWLIRSDGVSKYRTSNELWEFHELESSGLMSVCLKKIHELSSKNLKLIESR